MGLIRRQKLEKRTERSLKEQKRTERSEQKRTQCPTLLLGDATKKVRNSKYLLGGGSSLDRWVGRGKDDRWVERVEFDCQQCEHVSGNKFYELKIFDVQYEAKRR